ncbi:MAG: hypothetical protein JRJ06_02855 [Deltaproteobacteria bacterium]|nr:hypothetical protein [Deltaproteobacteria bacterium]
MNSKTKSWEPRLLITFFMIIVLFFSLVPGAHAHKVYLFAWVEGDTVYTDSYFSGKKKVQNGLIKVFDTYDKEILQGKTDKNGEFSFKVPGSKDLMIVLESSMGHRTEYLLKANEITGIKKSSGEPGEAMEPGTSPDAPVEVCMEEIKETIEEALDSRLRPISRRLADLEKEKGPGLTEILGGIGYIIGIMGLALYFKARKKD